MTERLVWAVVRQDGNGNGNRYRVGRYATREEAERIADALDASGPGSLYVIEYLDDPPAG